MSTEKYKAAVYLRISKEDGDKEESYSITNQRDLALNFLDGHPEIVSYTEFVDDGYSGSNFERPNFKKMIDLITRGKINCVVVKDLSRFAREYIGAGYFLEKLFPSLGIRFISINDGIDYADDESDNMKLVMIFKNIMNDSYLRDTSVKIRSNLEIKRKKGEYIGSLVTYGYLKSADDKHKIVVDQCVVEVIRNIYNKKILGFSAYAIADKLNLEKVPSPAEYKKYLKAASKGMEYKNEYQAAKWSAKAVIRILTNEIYTGTLIQGRLTTINHKIKKIIEKDRDQWTVIENNHEPIISKEEFEIVQRLMKRDTRMAPGKDEPYLFSGFLKCGDCNDTMVRRMSKYKDKVTVNYMCSKYKLRYGCSAHWINEDVIYQAVVSAINSYCRNVRELNLRLNEIPKTELEQADFVKIENAQKEKNAQISDLTHTIEVVQSRCRNNLENQANCDEICSDIRKTISELQNDIERLNKKKENIRRRADANRAWIKYFSKTGEIKELNRVVLTNLVDEIRIYDDKRIAIKFNYQDKYIEMLELISKVNREAVG